MLSLIIFFRNPSFDLERLRRNAQLRRLNEAKHIQITDDVLDKIAKKNPKRERLRSVNESLSVPI